MPVPKKKRITVEKVLSVLEPSSPLLSEQQEFHQHLRTLAQSTVRSLAEDEEHLFSFYQFPLALHQHIQTTNAI